MEVWENEKCCGNSNRRRVFPQLFRVLPNFQECFYNSIETRRTCFLILLGNTATTKRKTAYNCLLWYFLTYLLSSKCKFSLLAPSLCQQLVLVLCSLRAGSRWSTNARGVAARLESEPAPISANFVFPPRKPQAIFETGNGESGNGNGNGQRATGNGQRATGNGQSLKWGIFESGNL